jgi:hypothetical protein
LEFVKVELEKINAKKQIEEAKNKGKQVIDNRNVAYQELCELTKRKFLKQLNILCESHSTNMPFPRLFCLDLVPKSKLLNENNTIENDRPELVECVRTMCEHDEGWHVSETFFTLETNEAKTSLSSYFARIMSIIKNSPLRNELLIFQKEAGKNFLAEMESKAKMRDNDLASSYKLLREMYINEYQSGKISNVTQSADNYEVNDMDLKRCELKNGKILWLCEKHIKETNGRELSHTVV